MHSKSLLNTNRLPHNNNCSIMKTHAVLTLIMCWICVTGGGVSGRKMMDGSPEEGDDEIYERICSWSNRMATTRPYSVSLSNFGAVGDGVTLNTDAFQQAISHVSSYADAGGAQLYVPAGKWLTGNFKLTSHMTLFLDRDATILGSQDPSHWPIIEPLPSYGRGRELPGGRHISLIYGENLTDVVITGDNGTIDGQGDIWWSMFHKKTLDYTRGHLLELINSDDIIISNLIFLNSPFWNIHPVYSRNVSIRNLTILAPHDSPNTDGIDPDSSSYVCIEDCYVSNGDDIIAIKSGWDEYGIEYGWPSTNIVIRNVVGDTHSSSGVAIGSEMSGGISNVYVNGMLVYNALRGIHVKTSPGRGGYIRDIYVTNMNLVGTRTAIGLTGGYGQHPDGKFDPNALPVVERITIKKMNGEDITIAGQLEGIKEAPFEKISLMNIDLKVRNLSKDVWDCSDVVGYSENVFPQPCPQLCMEP